MGLHIASAFGIEAKQWVFSLLKYLYCELQSFALSHNGNVLCSDDYTSQEERTNFTVFTHMWERRVSPLWSGSEPVEAAPK